MSRNAKKRADREVAKSIALNLPDVEIGSHHGTMDIRVRNKICATFPASSKVVKLKSAEGWLEVALDDIDRDALERLLIDAWMFTAPPALRELHAGKFANRNREP